MAVMPSLLLDGADLGAQRDTDLGIQSRERFIQQKHLGMIGQGARQGHALLLPTRKLVRVAVALLLEVNDGQHFFHTLF